MTKSNDKKRSARGYSGKRTKRPAQDTLSGSEEHDRSSHQQEIPGQNATESNRIEIPMHSDSESATPLSIDMAAETSDNGSQLKKTRGRQKIDIKFIEDKNKRFTTFSKRKGGIMKKVQFIDTLTF